MTTLVWFRQDLRIDDNPALKQAAARGNVIPLFILDDSTPPADWRLGAASRWWLHQSLAALRDSLGGLIVMRGDPRLLIHEVVTATSATGVFWNRCYEPYAIARDSSIKADLTNAGIEAKSFNGNLLNEPWEIATQSGTPFKVYTPYWRACRTRPIAAPVGAASLKVECPRGLGLALDDLRLQPGRPNWAAGWPQLWQPGEAGAKHQLLKFLDEGLRGYPELRDRADLPNISRLSPHLHWGEISPRQIWQAVQMAIESGHAEARDADKFLSEIGWREFAHHLLFHFPTLPDQNWREAFNAYPWRESAADLKAWQRGETGYPMVDAGMRELWRTGFMHNRVRMIAASFLIKHLRINWIEGERWFWDTLLDADLANNAAGWQWVAGSGADAAPYFRIFNPMEQGRKFDPEGKYVRRWCPELAQMPNEFIHKPFLAPDDVLSRAGVVLGTTYPRPIVDHAQARTAALAGYGAVKSGGD